jgi:predicted DNA-binding protein (MmcQ/YjbR family)
MTLAEFQSFCESLKGVKGDFPFDDNALVYKVKNKMFAITNFNDFDYFSVKCDPEEALILRANYPTVKAGYHLSKKHWNSVYLTDDSIKDETLKEWIKNSYDLVVAGLSKKDREDLSAQIGD